METLRQIQNRIDSLSLRERGIILGTILISIYFLFDSFIIRPMDLYQKNAHNNIVRTNAEIVVLNSKIHQLVDASTGNQRQRKTQEALKLRQENDNLDQKLQQVTANLVTPQQMTTLLRQVLEQTDGLHLKKVTSLGSSPLVLQKKHVAQTDKKAAKVNDDEKENDNPANMVYKHGLQIVFDGNFFATLEYLKKLEQLKWNFIWDDIKFEVNDYPEATTTLSLYTISMDKNWIGV